MTHFQHTPVLLRECLSGLELKPGSRVIDCTTGLGGHTEAILGTIGPAGSVLAIDRDPLLLDRARERLNNDSRVAFVHGNFADIQILAKLHGFDAPDAILADLGICSVHVDDEARGFSFRGDAELDMRFDPTGGRLSAREVINTLSEAELTEIFKTFGEERYAKNISHSICLTRTQKEIKTTRELTDIIMSVVPSQKHKLHPATKVYQALRIYINDELGALTRMLDLVPYILVPGGRVAIISYHSLEDRIVKQFFKTNSSACTCPREQMQCSCGGPLLRLMTRKAIIPTEAEIRSNPRARSAKLRIAEKLVTSR